MKTQEIDTMSKKEEKLVDILRELGFNRGTAKTLIYMLAEKTARTRDIERAMDLRQPEVSIGTKELRKFGILSVQDINKKGKGRPIHQYSLNKSVSEVNDFICEKMQKEIKNIKKNLEAWTTEVKKQ